ncbi:MAG: WD40/YVTN/BNR-like repeat-containing protein [Myxococcales bacterium]
MNIRRKRLLPSLALVAAALACSGEESISGVGADNASAAARRPAAFSPTLTPQQSGTLNRLQAVSPVNAKVVWASGVGGTFALTTDGGEHWTSRVVPGAETLQFRDVEGVSDKVAYLLSAGVGTDSRIYKTEDSGNTWTLQFQNEDPNGFYDCFAFFNPRRGITMADAVNGRFPVIRTTDGRNWKDIGNNLPRAQDGEAAFAASGTCIATQGERRAWIGTGAAAKARIIATTDGGDSWQAFETPVVQGTPSSGILTVAFRDARHGILGAGELAAPDQFTDNVARSSDGGRTWQLGAHTTFPGATFGLAYARGQARGDDERDDGGNGFARLVVFTGPGGSAFTPDEGDTFVALDGLTNFWAVAFDNPQAGWIVGTEGRIVKISF